MFNAANLCETAALPATVAKFRLALCGKQIPEDVWQLRAPVDELVSVGQGGGKGDKLNLVTTEALGLGGHEVQLREEKDERDVLRSQFCFCSKCFTFLPRWKGTTLSSSACRINRGQEMWLTLAMTNSNTARSNKRHFLSRPGGGSVAAWKGAFRNCSKSCYESRGGLCSDPSPLY